MVRFMEIKYQEFHHVWLEPLLCRRLRALTQEELLPHGTISEFRKSLDLQPAPFDFNYALKWGQRLSTTSAAHWGYCETARHVATFEADRSLGDSAGRFYK